jgi:hypothetical protein
MPARLSERPPPAPLGGALSSPTRPHLEATAHHRTHEASILIAAPLGIQCDHVRFSQYEDGSN